MIYSRHGNKRPVETFLVANASDTLINAAGQDNITDSTDNSVRLADGQLGIYAANDFGTAGINTATTTTPDLPEAPVIYVAQGTADSANPSVSSTYPLSTRAYERTPDINGQTPVTVVKTPYLAPTHSTWVIGEPAGTAGQIPATPLDETEYALRVAYRGRRMDEFYSPEGSATLNAHFVTPNYTTLSTAEPRDHLIQNLVWNINRNSKAFRISPARFRGNSDPIVALAIDSTGSTGDNIGGQGTGATHLAAGDVVPVVNTSTGLRNITLTDAQATSIKNAAVAASGDAIADVTWSILTVDLSTAGTTSGGVADIIMLIALDNDLAYDDRIPQTKVRLDVGLTSGFDFDVVSHEEHEEASEGSGTGRAWDLWYKATHGQRKYNLDHRQDPVIEYPSPVNTAATYTSYTISHVDVNQIDTSNLSQSPQRSFILVPSSNTTLVSAIDAAFNSWLASANGGAVVTL